jgi:WD40 repeat protein
MAFSPDATRLAVGGCQGTVKIWELAEHKPPVIVQGHEGIVWSVAFSPGGETIASAGADGQVMLWDVHTGTQKTTIPAHIGDVQDVVFVHDGKTLVTAGLDSTIEFWDANTGELITTRKGHEGPVTCLAPFADGRRVASASSDGTVKVWSIPARDEQVFAEIPSAIFLGAAFSPAGEQLAAVVRNDPHDIAMRPPRTPASVSEDKLILWDWKQGIRLKHRNLNRLGLDTAVCPAFSPDGRLLAVREELMNVTWMLTGKFPPDIPCESLRLNEDLPRPQQSLCPVGPGAFFPDGKTLATPDLVHGRVELWNVPEGSRRDKFPTQATFCLCVAVSPDGSMLAVAADQNVQLWSADGRKWKDLGAHSDFADELLDLLDVPHDLARDLGGHTDFVRSVLFSHDGNTLVSASSDGTVKLWDVDTWAERATLRGHKGGVSWVAISPDDKTIASAGRDGTIKLWDLESGEEKTTLKGHASWVTSVAFSPDGLTLASTSEDGTLRLWKGATDQ